MIKIKCKVCGKEFEGHTEKQVFYYLGTHILAIHADQLNAKVKSLIKK